MARKIKISNDELIKLDLRQFNNGKSPYPESDKSLENAFKPGIEFFREYVSERTQFTGGAKVLDLLCGFGRWTPFLAEVNDHVIGLDRLQDCINIGRNFCRELGLDNVEFIEGDVGHIERFASNSFDYVWMYSALQYVDRGYTLWQVQRVIKPGGRLYVGQYNSTGLMLTHLWKGIEDNMINTGSSQWALNALVKGPDGDGNPNYATLENCGSLCSRHNLSLIKVVPCCGLDLREANGEQITLRQDNVFGHYYKTIEFIAEKGNMPFKGNSARPSYLLKVWRNKLVTILRRFLHK